MPRVRGNFDLLGALQSEYDDDERERYKGANLALREQMEGLREEHQAQLEDINQRAQVLHDQEISAKLATENLKIDQQNTAAKQTEAMAQMLGKLNPSSATYDTDKAAVISNYPHADFGEHSALGEVFKSYDAANSKWIESTAKVQQNQATLKDQDAWAASNGMVPDTNEVSAFGTVSRHYKAAQGEDFKAVADHAKTLSDEASFKAQADFNTAQADKETDPKKKNQWLANAAQFSGQAKGAAAQRADLEKHYPYLGDPATHPKQPAAPAAPAATPAPTPTGNPDGSQQTKHLKYNPATGQLE